MARKGYIMLPRELFDEFPLWDEKRVYSHFEAWLDLVQLAAFRPGEYRTEQGVDKLDRGEFVASSRYLATRWGWGKSTVRRWLDAVAKAGHLVGQRVGHHGTVYRIAKYDSYNRPPAEDGPANGTENGTVVGQPWDKVGEHRELREELQAAPSATVEPATRVLPFPTPPSGQLLYQPQPEPRGGGRRSGRDREAGREPGRSSKDFVEPVVEGAPVGWAVQLALVWTRAKGHPGPIQEFADLMAPLMATAVERGWGLEGAKKAIQDAVEITQDEARVKGRPELTRFLTVKSFAANASYWLDFANRPIGAEINGVFVS